MSLIECDGVTFGYSRQPVVEDVTLSVEAGEFLGLLGPNGSGKSTLLKLLLGRHEPDSGTVTLFGEPAHRFADGSRLGYVPQDTARPAMPVTVRETVATGRTPHAGFRRLRGQDRRAIDDAMARVGIENLASRRLGRLSGGQRQRAFIARALAAEADLLALDEPTVGVDSGSRAAFYDLLGSLNDEGLTVLLVEHDIGAVTAHASRVACLDGGLHFHGDVATFESEVLSATYGEGARLVHGGHG